MLNRRKRPYARFQSLVKERGNRLRKLAYEQLKRINEPTEWLTIESRPARIATMVQSLPSDGLRVVVQGFIKVRLVPMVYQVSLDGFYKYPDETMAP